MIHFGTTEEWERERFDILNMRRTRLSPNVLLRNRAAQCPSLSRLYELCPMNHSFCASGSRGRSTCGARNC